MYQCQHKNIFYDIINKNIKKKMIIIKKYQRLKDLRLDKELLQKDIAEILGTSRRQYSRWETGENELPMHHFIKLAEFYNVSLDYIAGLSNIRRSYKD